MASVRAQLLREAVHFLCMSCSREAQATKRAVEAQLDESVIAASPGLHLSPSLNAVFEETPATLGTSKAVACPADTDHEGDKV